MLSKFYTPTCVVQNVSSSAVRVIGLTTIQPGETIDLYKEIDSRVDLFEDPILKALEKPQGDLYVKVVIRKRLRILAINLPQFNYSIVHPDNIDAINEPSPGQIPAYFDGDQFEWIDGAINGVADPLEVNNGIASIPPASAGTDGYLTAFDWARFNSAVKGAQRIWQYQDFSSPVGTSLSLSAFENGTGLAFDASYIQDDTATIVLVSDNTAPPTTTLSFPGSVLPGNRVEVSSHIGTTVILNQAPDSSLTCRVYYLVSVPSNIALPNDYQEAPDFLRGAEYSNLDSYYVNQNADEVIYGEKTFSDQSIHSSSIRIPVGAAPGLVLTSSDGLGNAVWSFPSSSSGDGYWTSDNNLDIYNNNIGGVGIGTSTVDGYAKLDVQSTTQGVLIPRMTEAQRDAINNSSNGLLVFNTDENRVNLYDGYIEEWLDTSQPVTSFLPPLSPYHGQLWVKTPEYELFVYDPNRGKWISPRTISTSASRFSFNASNIYLRSSDGCPSNISPFVLPFDCTLVGMSASAELAATWTIEARVNNVLVPGASLTVSSATQGLDFLLNIDFSEGDAVQIYLSSLSGIRRPRATLFFSRSVA